MALFSWDGSGWVRAKWRHYHCSATSCVLPHHYNAVHLYTQRQTSPRRAAKRCSLPARSACASHATLPLPPHRLTPFLRGGSAAWVSERLCELVAALVRNMYACANMCAYLPSRMPASSPAHCLPLLAVSTTSKRVYLVKNAADAVLTRSAAPGAPRSPAVANTASLDQCVLPKRRWFGAAHAAEERRSSRGFLNAPRLPAVPSCLQHLALLRRLLRYSADMLQRLRCCGSA